MSVLEKFRNYHDKMYFQFRKAHEKELERVKTVDDFLREVVEKNDFSMCIKLDAFKKAAEENCFKNMMETSYGTTVGGFETRKQVVSTLFNVDAEKLAPEEFPKFGLLTGKDKMKDLLKDEDVFYHFGQILVTFKKENLIKRTTMTVGSSVNFGEFFRKLPVFAENPNSLALTGSVDKNPSLKIKNIDGFHAFYTLIIMEKLNSEFPNHITEVFEGRFGFEYYELQFFGRLTMDDVERIDYYPIEGNEREELEAMEPMFDKYGIKCGSLIPESFFL